ncbi:hypothetical protein [Haladaptatus sp. NG-WS-4]
MNVRDVLVEVGFALVSFLVVGALVTEVLRERIWPSLVVGIPAGIVAGVVAFALLHYYRGRTR